MLSVYNLSCFSLFSLIGTFQCLKSVRTRSFSGPYFLAFGLNTPYLSVFSPNAGKYGPEKFQIRTLFTQCLRHFRVFVDNFIFIP